MPNWQKSLETVLALVLGLLYARILTFLFWEWTGDALIDLLRFIVGMALALLTLNVLTK